MAQKNINLGSADYAGDGENIRSAFAKIQDNFVEIYATGIAESGPLVSDITGDVTGSVFASDSTLLVNGLDGTLSTYNLDQAGATDGQALVWNDGNSRWQPGTILGGGGGLANVVEDTTPQLGGDLDLNNFNIIGTGDIPAANLTGTLPALDGSNLTGVVASSVAFADVTATPTTLAGYGITDAYTQAQVDSAIADVTAGHFSFDITGDDSTVRSVTSGSTIAIKGGGDVTTASDVDGNITISFTQDTAFGSLTGTPTTLSGYGITDAFDGTFGSLTGTPTTLSGYGITDAYTKAEVDSAVANSFSFSVAADDSTLRQISNDESIKFVGAQNITTSSDAEGQITITGPDLSGYAQLGSSTTFTADVSFDTGVQEAFGTVTGATGVTALDCNNGHLFYLTGATGDITANFTNLGLTAEYATNLTVVIDQGGTEYEITAVQIGGVAQTIVWQGNSAPTGTANGVDSFSFTILNDGGTYVVLGQMVSFGGV